MTKALTMRYLKHDKSRKTYKYRRRVPDNLKAVLGKSEFVKKLGTTEPEALQNYPAYHRLVEKLLSSAQSDSGAQDVRQSKEDIAALFYAVEADPYSPGRTDGERLGREEEADRLLSKYVPDPETGRPDPTDLSPKDQAMLTALLQGVDAIEVKLTIKTAYEFYLAEKKEPDPHKRKKQVQRFNRSEAALLAVTSADLPIEKISRRHARGLRDHYLQKGTISSARRNLNDAKAVFAFSAREHDLNLANPFSKLDYPKPTDAAIDDRHPLPEDVIRDMYGALASNQVLYDVWTLMHHTGAQNAEILGLKRKNLMLDHTVPHIEIAPEGFRTVKNRSRARKVPLTGLGLQTAQRLAAGTSAEDHIFPKYADTSKHDNFSQAVRQRLRKLTEDKKHTIYSLRHNMKDALRATKAGYRVELAVLGHPQGKGSEAGYGSAVSLEEMHSAMEKIPFAIQEPSQ